MARTGERSLTAGLAWTSPWLVGGTLFVLVPMALSLYYSFTDYTLLEGPIWVGLDNYRRMLGDEVSTHCGIRGQPDRPRRCMLGLDVSVQPLQEVGAARPVGLVVHDAGLCDGVEQAQSRSRAVVFAVRRRSGDLGAEAR